MHKPIRPKIYIERGLPEWASITLSIFAAVCIISPFVTMLILKILDSIRR